MTRLERSLVLLLMTSPALYAESASSPVTVERIEVETTRSGIYFRVMVAWPSEGVPSNYAEYRQIKNARSATAAWPYGALALIPQGTGAFRVCREDPQADAKRGVSLEQTPALEVGSPAAFLGRLREKGSETFLLRCPQVGGRWQYLPTTVDFNQGKQGKGLAERWIASQESALSQSFSADNSFFAYAHSRLLARLGKTSSNAIAQPVSPPIEESEHAYEITTGALAMQESLQLDRMRDLAPDNGSVNVPVDRIKGVDVHSHPWKEMIGNRTPQIESIASLVPADQYYVRFTTTRALSDFLEFADLWGGSVLGMVETSGRDYGTKERLEAQICLKTSWLSRLLGPAVIESLVVTGSDPYLREGSDLTIVFHLEARPVFEMAVGRYLDEARRQHPDIREGREDHDGVAVEHLTTPDQVVRCYRAKFDDYFVYSNSPVAIRRVLDTYHDKWPSMAKSLDFAYIRTVYPLGDRNEDGFVFLSDPFIRSLVGPRTRIAEKRRLEAITSLEIIKNAALLYLWENPGARVPTLEQLYESGELDRKYLKTENSDHITWNPETFIASSQRYGRMGYLTPLIELPIDKVTAREEADYNRFRDRYQDYWRRYFDPIGIRVTAGRDIALSLTILPLINNSEYNQLKTLVAGKVVDLAPRKAAASSILYWSAHLNPKDPDLKSLQTQTLTMLPGAPRTAVEWIGERLDLWMGDSDALLTAMRDEDPAALFKIPIVIGVEVKNPLGLAAFLVAAQAMVRTSAPNMLVFEPTLPYRDFSFTRIRQSPQSQSNGAGGFADAAIYYGSIGNFFYISTSLEALHQIADTFATTAPASEPGGAGNAPNPETLSAMGHLAFRLNLANAKRGLEAAEFYLGQSARSAEEAHRQNLLLVAQTVRLGEGAIASPRCVLGYAIKSVLGNSYRYDSVHDEIVGSFTGSVWAPVKPQGIPQDSPLGQLIHSIRALDVRLAFTEDGLRSDLHIERK